MTKYTIISLLILSTISCNSTSKNNNLEGELYFSWLRIGSFYNQSTEMIDAYYKANTDSIINEGGEMGKLYQHYSKLEELGLLKSPYILLKSESGVVNTVFLDEKDYEAFTNISYSELKKANELVYLSINSQELFDNVYLGESIIEMRIERGITLPEEKKFKIEDYR